VFVLFFFRGFGLSGGWLSLCGGVKGKKVELLVCPSEDPAVLSLFVCVYCMKKWSVSLLAVIVRGGLLCMGSILGFSRVWP
jgi:hypothetical protein